MGRMFYLWIFFIQTSLGLAARDLNNLGFQPRLMRTPEEPNYRFLLPSRYQHQLISIQNIFYRKVFRTPEALNGNNFLSLFLPDEYKRSDFRCRTKVVTKLQLQLQLSQELLRWLPLYFDDLNLISLFRKPRSSTFKVRLF